MVAEQDSPLAQASAGSADAFLGGAVLELVEGVKGDSRSLHAEFC
jgi:hypothetical protein